MAQKRKLNQLNYEENFFVDLLVKLQKDGYFVIPALRSNLLNKLYNLI